MNLIGFLGNQRDMRGYNDSRWNDYRPSISAVSQTGLGIDTFYLLYSERFEDLLGLTISDISVVSPKTKVIPVPFEVDDVFDPQEMLEGIIAFLDGIPTEGEEFLISLATGTHVAPIAWFDLARRHIINAKFIQTYALSADEKRVASKEDVQRGHYRIIDLNLAKYDKYREMLISDTSSAEEFLKQGVKTENTKYNELISTIERVAVRNNLPILIDGKTGAGKTQLAKSIFKLKKSKGVVTGEFKYINCATLSPETAQSVLFGHKKGSFTGASANREGLLKAADKGVLFLDEIGTLSLEVQGMLLHALESKTFYPMGSDSIESSDFSLFCGTNVDLQQAVIGGTFREDLLARIDLWHFTLPSLSERVEDIAPNIDFELLKYEADYGQRVRFNHEAKIKYLNFAKVGLWKRNFRDLTASILRMATLSELNTITELVVDEEIGRLNKSWGCDEAAVCVHGSDIVERMYATTTASMEVLSPKDIAELTFILNVCKEHDTASSAYPYIYGKASKSVGNPTSILNGYLTRNFGFKFSDIKSAQKSGLI
ncbi:Transcriptional regulator [Vibrio chagasii]|nr:Transcriptional regulator [Vibrio chagasii]